MTLHQSLVHLVGETCRYAGHADIVGELIDGAVGPREQNKNMPPGHQSWWDDYRGRVGHAAGQAGGV